MKHRSAGFVTAAALVAAVAVSPPCRAQQADPPNPARLRTAAEILGFLGVDFALLWMTPPPQGDPPGNVRLVDKLTLKAWSFDASSFETNFAAHPVAGTFYYTTARSNRSGPIESLGWAAVSSLTWELAEFPENVSFNDLIVTPVAGASFGESLVQLSEWLARRNGSDGFLSYLLFPMKLANGAPPPEIGDDDAMAAHVKLIGGASLHGSPELGVSAATRLVHLPGYGREGAGLQLGSGGQVTGLSLQSRGAESGLTDFRFTARAGFFSAYQRDLDERGDGWDLLGTAGLLWDVRMHSWTGGRRDDWAAVHVPHLGLQLRRLAGPLRISLRGDVGVTLAGTRSFALDGSPGAASVDTLTATQRAWGYTMGWGLSAAPTLEIAWGPLSLEGGAAIDTRYGVNAADPFPDHHPSASLTDSWSTVHGALRLQLPWKDLELSAMLQRDLRRGSADGVTRTQGETVALFGLGFAVR